MGFHARSGNEEGERVKRAVEAGVDGARRKRSPRPPAYGGDRCRVKCPTGIVGGWGRGSYGYLESSCGRGSRASVTVTRAVYVPVIWEVMGRILRSAPDPIAKVPQV